MERRRHHVSIARNDGRHNLTKETHMATYLIVGASGTVGSSIVQDLAAQGHNEVVADLGRGRNHRIEPSLGLRELGVRAVGPISHR